MGRDRSLNEAYRPEEKVHRMKIERLNRAIASYLDEQKISPETAWQIDVVAVSISMDTRVAKIRLIENVILEK
jgi:Holliday junction resolvase-like predicted endonuclease